MPIAAPEQQSPAPIYLITEQEIDAYTFGSLERSIQKQFSDLKYHRHPQDTFLPCLQLESLSDQIETTKYRIGPNIDVINVNLLLPQEPSPFRDPPENHLLDGSWLVSHFDLGCDMISLHAKNAQTGREALIFFNARDERDKRLQFEKDNTKFPSIDFTLRPLAPTQTGIDLVKVTIDTASNRPYIAIENCAGEQVRTRINTYKTFRENAGTYFDPIEIYDRHIILTTYTLV